MSINIEASASTSSIMRDTINEDLSELVVGWDDAISVVFFNPYEVNDEIISHSDCVQRDYRYQEQLSHFPQNQPN